MPLDMGLGNVSSKIPVHWQPPPTVRGSSMGLPVSHPLPQYQQRDWLALVVN
jgi:hypothetical protein